MTDMAGWLEITGALVPSGTLHTQPLGDHIEVTIGDETLRLTRTGARALVAGITAWLDDTATAAARHDPTFGIH